MRDPYDSWQKASHHSAATCVECHLPATFVAKYLAKARAEAIQDRTERLMGLTENAVLALIDAVQAAAARGVRPEALGDARAFHRKAQWRLDFIAAENSKGFHAPQEAARILGEAIDFARRGQAAALAAGR
jgi:nitrite reductase (cytochrome c-552)